LRLIYLNRHDRWRLNLRGAFAFPFKKDKLVFFNFFYSEKWIHFISIRGNFRLNLGVFQGSIFLVFSKNKNNYFFKFYLFKLIIYYMLFNIFFKCQFQINRKYILNK
jgi:hypothetical protein